MGKCANCTHPVQAHGLQGCALPGCNCDFDYDAQSQVFNSLGLPVRAPNQGTFPCQICEGAASHHGDCPTWLKLPDGGGCMDCDAGPLAEHAYDCQAWSMLGKTWVRLRKLESDRFLRNEHAGPRGPESVQASARDSQVGGEHYRHQKVQVWDIWNEYQLGAFEGAIIKYLLRDKGSRLQDLKKARHTLDRLIEIEEEKGNQ